MNKEKMHEWLVEECGKEEADRIIEKCLRHGRSQGVRKGNKAFAMLYNASHKEFIYQPG